MATAMGDTFVENAEEAPRRIRRWMRRHLRPFAKVISIGVLGWVAAMYALKLYAEAWPLLAPLMLSNPYFFWASVIIAICAAIALLAFMVYAIAA